MTKELLVPKGTSSQRLAQAQLTFVANGVILSKVFLIEEAGKPPYQHQESLVFVNPKEALENIGGDL